jgi:phosphotriesterase-related protein
MATVETVRGAINTADLGRTYMHEHVFVLSPDVQQNYPSEWGGEDDRVADAVGKLKALAAQGIRSIADPTVVGLGRYIPRIQRIAEQVPGLNIIPATGCYTYDQVPFFFYYRGPALSAALGTEVPIRWWTCSSATSPRASRTQGSRPPSSGAPSIIRAGHD